MDWSILNNHQLGRYGEYYAKMEFAKRGFDIYSSEVDDKSIDFVVRDSKGKYREIQVKSVRNGSYVFMRKRVFTPREDFYVVLLVFMEDRIAEALIPSLEWKKGNRPPFLTDKNYEGKKSKPEYGIYPSKRNLSEIERLYPFPSVEKPSMRKQEKYLKQI